MLSACASSGVSTGPQRNLPAAPSFMAPVAVPPVKAGDDAREALARRSAALNQCNGNLIGSAAWYGTVRKKYGGPK